jgi:hypothetical protein
MPGWLKKILGESPDPTFVSTDTSPDGVYSRLRHQALYAKRIDVGISPPAADAPAWGALMETGYDAATVTLFALAGGTTSLYISTGGGVIGGEDHESVQQSNAAFIQEANRLLPHLEPCESFPVPEMGHTIFYVLTDAGILTCDALEDDLGEDHHVLSPLFYSGHEVIGQLRLISENNG